MIVFKIPTKKYPAQFWLMFWGMLLSTLGASMIWPFLMIYASQRLDAPLAQVGSLMTMNSAVGLVSGLLAGPVVDARGRKWIMVVSLLGAGTVYFLMGRADHWWHFAILMAFWGMFSPLYRVGGDAMLADLVPAEGRAEAYALLRIANNLGVAVGPAVGGFLAAVSYDLAFTLAAVGFSVYAFLLAFAARETLSDAVEGRAASVKEALTEYAAVLNDRRLRFFLVAFIFPQMCGGIMWIFLGVYVKQWFGIPESHYGLIATTNASMVVLLQYTVTRFVSRFPPLRAMAFGVVVYSIGVGSVALGSCFWHFWLSMVIMTVGEMILVPTAATYVANLAPSDKRGRYMGAYGMLWGLSSGMVAPVGGWLSDNVSPKAPWLAALVLGGLGASTFLGQERLVAGEEEGPVSVE